jgi:putative ABC transport system permease protein
MRFGASQSCPFRFAIVLTLALGIGLTTAIYSVVNAVLLAAAGLRQSDRVVWLTAQARPELKSGTTSTSTSGARTRRRCRGWRPTITATRRMVLGGEALVSGRVSRRMTSGRSLARVRCLARCPRRPIPPAFALAHHVFREEFHSGPGIVGQAVTLDGRQATIAAVLPEDFRPQLGRAPFDPARSARLPIGAYRIMRVEPRRQRSRRRPDGPFTRVVGELKGGRVCRLSRHARRSRQSTRAGSATSLSPWRRRPTNRAAPRTGRGAVRLALRVLLSASLIELLIACANAPTCVVAIVRAPQGNCATHVCRQRADARDSPAAGREHGLRDAGRIGRRRYSPIGLVTAVGRHHGTRGAASHRDQPRRHRSGLAAAMSIATALLFGSSVRRLRSCPRTSRKCSRKAGAACPPRAAC